MTTMMRSLYLFLLLSIATANNLRPTKKYLRCPVEDYGCGMHDRVNLCHYNGKEFETFCVKSNSAIVEHLHESDYCGKCVESERKPFAADGDDLKQAVMDFLDDKSSHKRLAATYGWPMSQWDVSQVQDFSYLFAKRHSFQEDISLWNTQSATDMKFMFWHAHAFAGDISQWNVQNVVTMERMFFGAESFNSDISAWQTVSLTNMMGTFWRATSFNAPIGNWDTSKVTTMSRCFSEAVSFNQPLDQWDTRNVMDMSYMFLQAHHFQQDLSMWKVHNVATFERMFAKAPYFAATQVQQQIRQHWNMRSAVVNHMFTAPRDLSLRQQQLQNVHFNVQTYLEATKRAHQHNATSEEQQDPAELSREILCHGGICM